MRTLHFLRFTAEFRDGFTPVIPPRASELLARIARRGAAWRPLVFRGAGKPLLKTLVKSEKRRIKAESGSPFLWVLSFGEAKESISAVGPRTDF